MFTESLGIHLGGTSGQEVNLPPLPLFNEDGSPNLKMVAAHAAVTGETVNVSDAYVGGGEFDFSGTRAFDQKTGYRSRSFLAVPMRNHEDEVIGVLQLLNAMDEPGAEPRPFTDEEEGLVTSLTSQAAIAITNRRLIQDQRELFEAFIQLMAAAIDDKSPYTGGHCRRVPELTMMLADAAVRSDQGSLSDFSMTEEELRTVYRGMATRLREGYDARVRGRQGDQAKRLSSTGSNWSICVDVLREERKSIIFKGC